MTRRILRGGHVVDGRGTPRFDADVLIEDGRIASILSPGTPVDGAEELDVSGLVVAPGFIDMHAHSDLAVLADTEHLSKVAQGVTLEVVGQDGIGYAPVTAEVMDAVRHQIFAWNGNPALDYSWRTIADYLERVDRGAPVNVAVLIPQGSVRMMVMGTDPRPATEDERAQMREIIAQGMREGAMGVSTGLTYTPGMYASDDELVDILGAVAGNGGFYCTHHRNYGSQMLKGYVDSIEVARRAGVPLHLAHCNANFPVNKGRAPEVLAAIDRGLDEGVDITLDAYPYLAAATNLAALLPSWAHTEGAERTIELLADPESRSRILHEMEVTGSDGFHGIPVDWSIITIAAVEDPANAGAVGKTIPELARERGQAPGDAFADLLIEDRLGAGCVTAIGNEENVRTIMQHSRHTLGTDGVLEGARPHPRGWGSFPRFLGVYVREENILTLEDAVAHLTSRAARRLGLTDRGTIEAGNWADVVVFDPETIASPATYEEPKLAPIGIHHVFVNGEPTIRDGRRTRALPGRAIRRAGSTATD